MASDAAISITVSDFILFSLFPLFQGLSVSRPLFTVYCSLPTDHFFTGGTYGSGVPGLIGGLALSETTCCPN
jgi:hypothetical protein